MNGPLKRVILGSVVGVALTTGARSERLGYHEIQTDSEGRIRSWAAADPGQAYDKVIRLVWDFWKHVGTCSNGVPYFFQHQVWKPEHDGRGLGGDQLAMALSSLNLLYAYTGDPDARAMMVRIADYYLDHGFSKPTDAWPNLPFPYNTVVHSGIYDGDMRAGKGFLQPDKAGSFGIELVTLYEMTGNQRYLTAAVKIADTLAAKVAPGDAEHSPWPFRVEAQTGQTTNRAFTRYTANWTGTLRLFDELIRLRTGQPASYRSARAMLGHWLKTYPLKSNVWGPFFEDIVGWSNTEINADTMAWYLLEHPRWDRRWRRDARSILDWSFATFATNRWAAYGVFPIQEQTAYRVPGNSHTSRHASVELIYAEKTGDHSRDAQAIRQLNWATYMVDTDGKNRYPNDDIWLTDGYGDYLRHYLRAMAAAPQLAPAGQDHLLRSSSVVQQIDYGETSICYHTFDPAARERLRVSFVPASITAGDNRLQKCARLEDLDRGEGYFFAAEEPVRGLLEVRHSNANTVTIQKPAPPAGNGP